MSFNSKNQLKMDDFIKNTYKFGEICEVLNGRAYKKNELLESGKYTVLRVGNFFSSDNWYYSDLELDANKYCDNGDLLFAWSASFGPKIWDGGKVIYHYHIWKLVPSPFVDTKFLYYWLLFSRNKMLMGVHGSVMGHLTKSSFEKQKISLPDILEQKAIAHILSTLDDKIEVNNQINKTLENMAQAIFKQWFVDFEFPNEDGDPYKSSGGEMVESELGMIPKGWEVKTILEMDLIVTDYVANGSFKALKENVTLYEEYNYAIFMRNTDLKCNFNSGMKYVDQHSYDFLKKSQLFGGEVIISNVGDVGSVYLCPYFDQPMTLGNNVIMVKAETNQIWNHFVYRLFNSREGQGMIDSITGGSAQPKFNKTDFRNLKVVIPSEMFISNYMKTLSSIEDCILLNDKQNSELIKIRDSLLPKLMSGEIRVPMDEEGEAS